MLRDTLLQPPALANFPSFVELAAVVSRKSRIASLFSAPIPPAAQDKCESSDARDSSKARRFQKYSADLPLGVKASSGPAVQALNTHYSAAILRAERWS